MAKLTDIGPTGFCRLCGKEFLIPASAENKKFCSSECRREWHKQRGAKASRLLKEMEKQK